MQILPALETGGTERVAISLAVAVKKAGYHSVVVSNGGQMIRELPREGVEHIQLPVHSKNILTVPLRVHALKKAMRRHEIKLVHAHSRVPAWLGYRAARSLDAAFMTTGHGFFHSRTALKRRYSSIIARGTRAVAVSKFIHDYLRDELGAKQDNLRTIPLGVQFEHYDPEKVSTHRMIKLLNEWYIPEETPLVMLPGRVSRTKGHEVLIEAIAKGRKDVRYLIVGNYQNRPRFKKELDRLIAARGVGDQIQFVGTCRDMPAAYRICDVVVVPSVWPEPGGTVAIEAQAMGKPVIVSDAGGMAESVIDGQTGYIVRAGDAEHLAAFIDTALNLTEPESEKMRKSAMQRARQQFSNELMCRRYLDVYRELLEGAAPNPDLLGFPHLA